MAKNDGKGDLKKKLKKLKKQLKAAVSTTSTAPEVTTGPQVSPLAPASGFPALPVIGGVRFAAAEAGVKYRGRLDVMLAEVAAGSSVAGVFTRSSTRSAPVLDCQAKLAMLAEKGDAGKGFAILVNSGNSNAFTGAVGVEAVKTTTNAVAKAMKIPEAHVFTASTGVIGVPLPAERIVAAIDTLKAGLDAEKGELAARAIMTTDTFPKGSVAHVDIDGKTVKIAGFAKGSGMIAPDMATMLVYIFTDAKVAQGDLQKMVSAINKDTFNAITVDSDTSTSDSLMLVATGASGAEVAGPNSATGKAFVGALRKVMLELAHLVVKDGEGATKFVEIEVTGATSSANARKVAMAIANSPLVKTAIAGQDPNWGRIVMAVGKSGAPADRDRLAIRFGDILVAENGWVSPAYTEEAGAAYFKQDEIKISTDLGMGNGSSTVWTCDFTKRYIEINADYRS
jgi:glutamate N-acetyltransferase/amino-acid N-acetyltransferase